MSATAATVKPEQAVATEKSSINPIPVVMTKIRVPRWPAGLLSRRRLVDFLHTHLDRKLILIAAPAGYGKTSLLTDFAHDTELPVCWYTLDPFDHDLRVFLEHLIAAIAVRFTNFGERSRAFLRGTTDPGHDLYPLVATLLQEIYDTIPEYFVLILDDYHTVEDQDKITEFLDLFVTYADENCHLIIASRTLPALPNLSLLLARRQATGLSIDELRFLPQEIQTLAQQNYNLTLTPEQAEELVEQTEGWITGLLLTTVPRWEQAQGQMPVQGRVNVGLYDYLSRQVLSQQPAPLRDFLLASSVLDELDPDLCTAVLQIDRPLALMDQLRARNLFVMEFEGGGDRLRYHDLFRDFLQTTLRRQDEARYRELTRRAADAYVDRGELERAVSRYLTLQDYDRVAEIIEQHATRMFEAGRWDTLAGWIDALPEAIRIARPHCLVHRGRIYMERGEHTLAQAMYDQARQALIAIGDKDWAAYALALRGWDLRYQGRYAEAMASCQEALALASRVTEQNRHTIALSHRYIGLCHISQGQLTDGLQALEHALQLYDELHDPYNMGTVHHDLGLAYELKGDLNKAANHYQAALQQWQQLGNLGAWANTLNSLGVIHYMQGHYDQALQFLNEALDKVKQVNYRRVEALIWASLGDLHRDLGAYELAQQAYADGLQTATRSDEGFVVTYVMDGLGNTFRLQGNWASARQWLLDALDQAERHGSTYEIGLCHTSLGILELGEGNPKAARKHLDQATELFQVGGFRRELARACLYEAYVSFLSERRDKALAALKKALAIAEQLGFDHFLVVDGQEVQPLLRWAAEQWTESEALSNLLERVQAHQSQLARRVEPVVKTEPQLSLRIYALGKPRVELDGKVVQWRTIQARDMLFCLLQNPEGLSKEEIGELFWPEHSPVKLHDIFRSTLYRLRRALFREIIVLESDLYCFNWQSDHWFDVEVFERLLDQAEEASTVESKIALLQEALILYQGDYLEDMDAEWCLLDRERLRERFVNGAETLATLYQDSGKLEEAIKLYQQILARDPYRESAYRGLMLCYYRLGDRTSAVQQYQICTDILRTELGLSPSPETAKLFLKIIG